MKRYSIKLKKTTPVQVKGTSLSIEEYRLLYPSIVNEHNTDEFLINYLKTGYKSDNLDIDLGELFEVVEEVAFIVGDWVWHEHLNEALLIKDFKDTSKLKPNECSIRAVIAYPIMYKRKATLEEIKEHKFLIYLNDQLLVSTKKVYLYRNKTWVKLNMVDIKETIKIYLKMNKLIVNHKFRINDQDFDITTLGLKIGCTSIDNETLIAMAKILKLIP